MGTMDRPVSTLHFNVELPRERKNLKKELHIRGEKELHFRGENE